MKECSSGFCLALLLLVLPSVLCEEVIPLGTIFSKWNDHKDVYTVMQFALEQQHNNSGRLFKFKLSADNINTVDAFKLTKIICRQFERGIYALMGSVDPESFDTLHSFANAYEMPFVTPWFPESIHPRPVDTSADYAIQIRPEYHQGIVDVISYYGWNKVIYIYSDFDGLLRLQRIYRSIPKTVYGSYQFNIEMVKKISSPKEAIDFLLEIERLDRHSVKRIVLDCSASIAKEILVDHVRNVHLGRRNFHYLMSGLVFDDEWNEKVAEYGAINVTGFRIVHRESDHARRFLRKWKQLDRRKYPAAGVDGISSSGALAYDAVTVMEEGFRVVMREDPGIFKYHRTYASGSSSRNKALSCDMIGDGRQTPWEHGATISRALRSLEINGITGQIRFDSAGKRTNFSLDLMEMTSGSRLLKIGSWGDENGLRVNSNPMLNYAGGYITRSKNIHNKTFIMTSILEEPYLMWKKLEDGELALTGNDRFEGYSKDLADLISKTIKAKFEIRVVKDGKYGSPDPDSPGGWNGMIGELIRNEAEIAIAPLTIHSQREQVADFSKPFMSLGISIMIKKPAKQRPGVFSFMNPLSMEIWMCVVFAYIGVSIVLFLVSRFSPYEWKIDESIAGTTVSNHFSITNSLWFALGAFMQQGTDVTPRSVSGRIVGGAWWFFSLIVISSYTANLAAFLTVERMVTPIDSADDLAKQTEIEYGSLLGGSTASFFQNSKISVYARMWEFMSSHPHVMTNSTREGIQRVRESKGKYAFLIESTYNEYTNERRPCDTMKVGKDLDAKGYGIATAKGSGLKEEVNLAVLHLKENGDLAKLRNTWWYERTECAEKTEQSGRKNELSLSNVAGVFFILIGGLITAMAMALLEFCVKSRTEAKRAKTTLSDAMKNKARLALSGGRDLDSIRFYGDSSAL
ncbi:glutamate receptor 1 [Lepeophtheirus salmonis]|uniref:glutamate receptor 1 n=1 Tax=Lepeophtheirus salmonis TaxID=72036 RepID=UPI001AE66648|nr:glutamate receptor 1-like [Lepeophtheirus salmonis]